MEIMKISESNSVFQDKNVRFTVVHPHCIRIEESQSGHFVNEPSLFAIRREARFSATVKQQGKTVSIDTGKIRLVYKSDGKPLSPANLKAEIRSGKKTILWQPDQKNLANLGGTAETLDGWVGARQLPDGLLSRDGWQVIDDSVRPLLANGWVKPRKNASKDWYLFGYGTDFRGAFQALASISGPASLPRRCTLGAWYSRYWPYTSEDYRGIVKEYEQHGFPLDVMVMDMDWHINDSARAPGAIKSRSDNQVWTGYTWDRELLPDAEKLLDDLHRQGLAVTLNDHPANGVQPHEEMYAAFMKAMGKPANKGEIIPFDAADRNYLETFYKYTHANLEKDGVDFWWLDWQQERDTRGIAGLTNLEWLNHYFYQRAREDGKRGQSFSRWGGWGDHRNPIHFSGDADTGWDMLAFQVPFTSVAGNVGCFFWSHDIGGHQGGRNEESYTRWCQFGAFSAALRSHSTRKPDMDRRPWSYPKWAESSMRKSFQMRSEWFPYLYSCAAQACRDTVPFIRPMYLDTPEVEEAYHNPQQFKLGEHVLVAPVAEPGIGPQKLARQAVWFPQGTWYNVFSGERFEGPCERLVAADIDEMPLFVRGGAPLPMQPYTPRMGKGLGDQWVIRSWPGEVGQTIETELYEDDGETEQYLKGECARTRLIGCQTRTGFTLRIEPTQGVFAGQVTEREVTVVLPCTQRPAKAMVNGEVVKVNYDAPRHETRISLPKASIREPRVVDVEVQATDSRMHRAVAFLRRVGVKGIDAGGHFDTCFQQVMKRATAVQKELALRAAGIGLFNKNESCYGYPSEPSVMLFLPDDVELSRTARLSLKGQEGGERTRCPVQNIVLRGPGNKRGAGKIKIELTPLIQKIPTPASELLMGIEPVRVDYSLEAGGVTISLHEMLKLMTPHWKFRRNLAPSATATASSWEVDQPPSAAIDGVVDGIPGIRSREWASKQEKAGAWLRLDWEKPVTAGRVLLFDRPNVGDHVVAGRLVLSDGTVLPVGELPMDGKTPFEVTFTPRAIQWMMFVVTEVSDKTGWIGLSEMAVYKA